jgi:hypothetical protein
MQGDGAADGNARQRDLSRDGIVIQQRGDIVGHRVERKLAAHLLRQARAAAIVAQDLTGLRESRGDLVPAFKRAAHLVHQHQRFPALAAELVAQAGAIDFGEFHAALPLFPVMQRNEEWHAAPPLPRVRRSR